jgi:hypothetical protein
LQVSPKLCQNKENLTLCLLSTKKAERRYASQKLKHQAGFHLPCFPFFPKGKNNDSIKKKYIFANILLLFSNFYIMSEKQEKRKMYMQEYLARYRNNHHEIKITFSNADYATIKRIAEKQGMKTAVYIRNAIHEQTKHLYLFPLDIEEQIKQAVRNMRGIGNNINQIARYCNEQRYSSPDSLEAIFNFLRKIEEEIKGLKLKISPKK